MFKSIQLYILIIGICSCGTEKDTLKIPSQEQIEIEKKVKLDLDSLILVANAKKILSIIQNPTDELLGMLNDKIYCVECFDITSLDDINEFTEESYFFDKKTFLNEHIEIIKDFAQKALESDAIAMINNDGASNKSLVLFNIYGRDELTKGHEGLQLGLGFEKVNNEFKLSSIETIP